MKRAELRRLVAKWPGVTEDIKWGHDLVYSVGGKMFAATAASGPDDGRLSFKVVDDRFLELTDQPGIIPAPYAARFKWVAVTEPKRFTAAFFEQSVRGSYELVRDKLPKRTRDALGGTTGPATAKATVKVGAAARKVAKPSARPRKPSGR